MEKEITLDAIDRRILRSLQRYPEASISEIGADVGLSQTPCWKRLKRLREKGVVRGRCWIIDPVLLGLPVNVFAELRLKQHDEETLERLDAEARKHPEIVECFSMSGNSDYLLRIVVRSVEHYEILLKKVLLHLPGVASINSSFALKTVKMTTDLPL